MSSSEQPKISRRNFMRLAAAATGHATTAGLPIGASAMPELSGLLGVLYEGKKLKGLEKTLADPLGAMFDFMSCTSADEFNAAFTAHISAAFEEELAFVRHRSLLGLATRQLMQSDRLWKSLPADLKARLDEKVSKEFDGYPEKMPNSTLQQRRNLAAAYVKIAQGDHPKTFVSLAKDADSFIKEDLWFKISDALEESAYDAKRDGGVFYNFQKYILETVGKEARKGNVVSLETFKRLGLDSDFGSYEKFMSNAKEADAPHAAAELEQAATAKANLIEGLKNPGVLIIHTPRHNPRGDISYGLVESYHIIDTRTPPSNPSMLDLFRDYCGFFKLYDYARPSGNHSELHISDPPRALKLLLDAAMRTKAPPTSAQML